MGDGFVLVVSGSRYAEARDEVIIEAVLDHIADEVGGLRLVHGGAFGVDQIAGDWARRRGFEVTVFPALWKVHGKAAGPIRNQAMIDAGCDVWAAFPIAGEPNKGTQHFIKCATDAGVRGEVYELPARTRV